ncbi:hypothetical protein OPV22_009252 [Ensete ventricosum]|uniref:Uncharacterized protein n=1 Tax=Ensete ventricosum TaxID=4639 RepID=A0AAV8PQX6_ENSVE|nr:hypothetical protein OPV22_009252 [Ensete ventricosum]
MVGAYTCNKITEGTLLRHAKNPNNAIFFQLWVCVQMGREVYNELSIVIENGSGDEHDGQPLVSVSCNPDELCVRELHGRALAHHRRRMGWRRRREEKPSTWRRFAIPASTPSLYSPRPLSFFLYSFQKERERRRDHY